MNVTDSFDLFYDQVQSFTNFSEFTNTQHFVRVPEDWFVIVTDVVSSTKAIEEGRYKDVNTIGAAAISVVQETLQHDFPFVFGGDGATLLIPAQWIEQAMAALRGLKRLAAEKFDINLRVGRIGVKEVYEAGADIQVARHELTSGKSIAIFRGGGLAKAESRIKSDSDRYCLSDESEESEETMLKGLSCRWNAIPSKRGCVMSLLIQSRDPSSSEAYERFLEILNTMFTGGIDDANPIHAEVMNYKGLMKLVAEERRYYASVWSFSFLARLVEIFAAVAIFKWGISSRGFNPTHYRNSMRVHSDFRKFDDMLRMIIDCSEEQKKTICRFLEEHYQAGVIFYGTHISDSTLMTCYVQDLNDGGHMHFIDGGDGGYAMAAKQLKEQMKNA